MKKFFARVGVVVLSLVIWRIFIVATWLAGENYVWRAPAECAPAEPGWWSRLIQAFLGRIECGLLHPVVALALLLLAVWASWALVFRESDPLDPNGVKTEPRA